MSWQFDYERAWETWAKPEFLKLPEEVKKLVRYVAIQCEGRHQNNSLGMDWFGDMKERFAAIDTETLRKAAVVIYNYGCWYHSGYAKNTDQAWLEPDYLADSSGGSWKFDLFAKQHLAVERGDIRSHLAFDQLVGDKFDYYTHDEGTDLCADELVYKYKELVKPMFEAVDIVVVNVQVKDCRLEPHLFVIGKEHFPKDGGMCINVHQSGCSHCKRPYENHTHEKALGLRLLRDIPKTEGAEFLKTLTSSMAQDKLVGFAFYRGYKFIGDKDDIAGIEQQTDRVDKQDS